MNETNKKNADQSVANGPDCVDRAVREFEVSVVIREKGEIVSEEKSKVLVRNVEAGGWSWFASKNGKYDVACGKNPVAAAYNACLFGKEGDVFF